jgi:L-iditol 2-dehydrogenase
MCEFIAVPKANLTDTHRVDDLRPIDAALLEPLACVMKSIICGNLERAGSVCVIGLGVMGLMHLAAMPTTAYGIDTSLKRIQWAESHGFRVDANPPRADSVVVCPGTPEAFQRGLELVNPGGTIVMFAPFSPGESAAINWDQSYFDEIKIVPSYSCGPDDMKAALRLIRSGAIQAEHFVSDFVSMDEFPSAYVSMKSGDIVKAMVVFDLSK